MHVSAFIRIAVRCPDYVQTRAPKPCKHIYNIEMKALQCAHVPLEETLQLSVGERIELFTEYMARRSSAVAHISSDPIADHAFEKLKIPIKAVEVSTIFCDCQVRKECIECSICCETFEKDSPEPLAYCFATCGNVFHEKCLKAWLTRSKVWLFYLRSRHVLCVAIGWISPSKCLKIKCLLTKYL